MPPEKQSDTVGGRWVLLIVRGSTTTLPFSAFSDYVTFSSRAMCRRLWLVCHDEQGLLETDLPVCSLAIPEGTVGKGALQARRQIVQRPKPIGSALGGCLISWCIIPGCLLCQFATGATLSSQLRGPFSGHMIAKGTLKGFQFTATTVILTVPTTTHHSFNMIQNSSCFPESYNLPSFKSNVNKLDLISLSS